MAKLNLDSYVVDEVLNAMTGGKSKKEDKKKVEKSNKKDKSSKKNKGSKNDLLVSGKSDKVKSSIKTKDLKVNEDSKKKDTDGDFFELEFFKIGEEPKEDKKSSDDIPTELPTIEVVKEDKKKKDKSKKKDKKKKKDKSDDKKKKKDKSDDKGKKKKKDKSDDKGKKKGKKKKKKVNLTEEDALNSALKQFSKMEKEEANLYQIPKELENDPYMLEFEIPEFK